MQLAFVKVFPQTWLSAEFSVTLASSEDEQQGGLSPPPQKKARLSLDFESDMHRSRRTSKEDGEPSTSNGELITNGNTKPSVKKKSLSKVEEDVVRLVGQHLQGLGLT